MNDYIHGCFDITSDSWNILITDFDFRLTNQILRLKEELDQFKVAGLVVMSKTDVSSDIVFDYPKLIGYLRYNETDGKR